LCEKVKKTDRQTDRQTADRYREKKTQRDREKQTERQGKTDREREKERMKIKNYQWGLKRDKHRVLQISSTRGGWLRCRRAVASEERIASFDHKQAAEKNI
jgi:hypothetical protein